MKKIATVLTAAFANDIRVIIRDSLSEFVRGRYHEAEPVLSEDCFGDWMVDDYNQIVAQLNSFVKDPLAFPLDNYQSFFSGLIELFVRNKDTCQFMKVTDDWKNWCSEDMMRCVYG